MRPIDLLSSRYYSIKPKGHDGGSNRWRARPVMAAAILLLMSLAVLLPAMVLAQNVNQAPTGLTAVPGDAEGSIFLDWDQSTDTNINSYEYQTRVEGGTWPGNYDGISGDSACCDGDFDDSATITGSFDVGTTYEVRIIALDSNSDESPPSNVATVKAGPAAVTGLTATAGHQSVTLGWTYSNAQDVTYYEYSYKPGAWVKGPDSSDTETDYTYTVTGLNNGTEYTFQVRAYVLTTAPAIDAPGGAGDEATATPGVPAEITFTVTTGFERVRLDFAAPTDSTVTGYEYRVAPVAITDTSEWEWVPAPLSSLMVTSDGDSMLALLVSKTTGSKATDPATDPEDLENNTSYNFNLRAVNGNGAGPAKTDANGEEDDTEASPRNAAPTAPTGPVASPGNARVTLSWDAVTNYAGVAYEYCWKTPSANCADGDTDWAAVPDSDLRTTSHPVTELANGTEYSFQVRAVSAADATQRSNATTMLPATPGLPSMPTKLTAVPGDAELKLEWIIPSGNGSPITKYGYRMGNWRGLYRYTALRCLDLRITTATATVDVQNQTSEQTYQLVRAVNDNGNSAPASVDAQPDDDPPAPTGLTATPGPDSGQVTLTWTAPVYLDISSYEYSTDTGTNWAPIENSDDTTAQRDGRHDQRFQPRRPGRRHGGHLQCARHE